MALRIIVACTFLAFASVASATELTTTSCKRLFEAQRDINQQLLNMSKVDIALTGVIASDYIKTNNMNVIESATLALKHSTAAQGIIGNSMSEIHDILFPICLDIAKKAAPR